LKQINKYDIIVTHTRGVWVKEEAILENTKNDVLKRLNFVEGHLAGIRRMVDEDKYCVDVLKQTFAVRCALQKIDAVILNGTYTPM
jgi:DNA-binding FrmR family transcriptional regulator